MCAAAVLLCGKMSAQETGAKPSSPVVVWLPFPSGVAATCAQGPFGTGTHSTGYAWDFVLREGTPILAPADGRVVTVIDDRKGKPVRPAGNSPAQIAEYQRLSVASANQLVIDHGGGLVSNFWHHKAGTARVRAGDQVKAGTHLADVGMSGTFVAHICFSMFNGPGRSCDLRFRSRGEKILEIKTGQRCVSGTPLVKKPTSGLVKP